MLVLFNPNVCDTKSTDQTHKPFTLMQNNSFGTPLLTRGIWVSKVLNIALSPEREKPKLLISKQLYYNFK